MKKMSYLLTVAATLGCLNFLNATASAQGSLMPPLGAPAPVMKSLDQVEARIPLIPGAPGVQFNITNGNYTITQAGSYYLTGNLIKTNSSAATFIYLATNNISLDLNGFTIFGTTGYLGTAIEANGYGYRICNGQIVGGTTQTNGVFTEAGFAYGIMIQSPNVYVDKDCIISDLIIRGVRDRGISAAVNSVAERCLVDTAGGEGINIGSIRDSRAINTKGNAIESSSIINCVGKCVGTGWGIAQYGGEKSNVQNSIGEAVSGIGLSGTCVSNSRGFSVSNIGLSAITASSCYGESVSGTGLSATTATGCVGYRSGGIAVKANIGIGCYAMAGTNQVSNKYNMP